MDFPFPNSLISVSKTMTADAPVNITDKDIPFYDCNIFVYDNSLYHGFAGQMNAVLDPGAVAWYRDGNLRDFSVQNVTAGANGKVVAVCTVPNTYVKQALGLI